MRFGQHKPSIHEYSKKEVLDRWESHFEPEILKAFSKSKFSESFEARSAKDVAEEIHSIILMPQHKRHVHVAAFDSKGKLLGACFNVKSRRRTNEGPAAEYGWFFTSEGRHPSKRSETAKDLIGRVHEVMRKGGFDQARVEPGTRAGSNHLKRVHGYSPDPKDPNFLVYDLKRR